MTFNPHDRTETPPADRPDPCTPVDKTGRGSATPPRGSKSWLLRSATIFGLCAASTAAVAQTGAPTTVKPSTRTGHVEEVVVTARKRSENVQRIPVAVTAISGTTLKNQSIKTIANLQGFTPGLVLQPAVADPQSLLFLLRGRQQNDVSLAVDPSVGLYIDGHYIPRGFGLQGSLLDINRVEILRGPQGTLYGKNTTGGAVAIYTNDPTHKYTGSVDATLGNYGLAQIVGIANLPFAANLDGRFVVERGSLGGYGQNLVGDRLLSEQSQAYRGKLRATWGDSWSAVLSADYQSLQSGGPILNLRGLNPAAGGLPVGGLTTIETEIERGLTEPQAIGYLNSLIAQGNSHFYNDTATTGAPSSSQRKDVGLTISGDLSDALKFVSITGYQHADQNVTFPPSIPVYVVDVKAFTHDNYYSQEFQLLGKNGPFKWVAGLYGDYEHGTETQPTIVIPGFFATLGAPSYSNSANVITNSTVAPFGQATWTFLPGWDLTGGIRYSLDTRQMDANDTTGFSAASPQTCVVPAPGTVSTALPGGVAQCPRTFKNTYRQPSWMVSIDHQFDADTLAYVKLAEGYRSGGQNEGGAVDAISFNPFKPETNLEEEVGFKTEFFDRKVRLNVAAYHDGYTNLQVTTDQLAPDGNFVTLVNNAASAEIQGVEQEADVILAPGLKIHDAVAYTDAHYNQFLDAALGNRSHENFGVPHWTVSGTAQYDYPVSFGNVLFVVDYNWTSTHVLRPESVVPSQTTQGPVGLLDARLNVHVDAWNMDFALFGKNITGEKYYSNGESINQLGINSAFAGPPATYGLEITKSF